MTEDAQHERGDQQASGDAGQASLPAGEPATIAAELARRIEGLTALELVEGDDGIRLAVARIAQRGWSARRALARRLISELAAAEIVACPLLFTDAEWGRLGSGGDARRTLSLAADTGQLLEHYRQREGDPRPTRRWVLATVRAHRDTIDFLVRSSPFALHTALGLAASAMREAFELLYATRGLRFDPGSPQRFCEEFVRSGPFEDADLQGYLDLVGLGRRCAIGARLDAAFDEAAVPLHDALRPAATFLKRLERYLRDRYTSQAMRRRTRRLRLVGTGCAGAGTVAALVAYVVMTWPQAPLADTTIIKKPGFITGHYYQGTAFEQKAGTRADRGINFSTTGAPFAKAGKDKFSVRWQGYLFFPEKGSQELCVEMDDGARLFFNGKRVVSDWARGAARRRCATVHVRKGWYPIGVEYYDLGWVATMRLLRGPDKDSARLVPAKDLCCGT